MRAWIMLGRQRGSWKLCSQNDFVTSKPTSMPTRSASSNGPIRKPPPMRMIRSIVGVVGDSLRQQLERLHPERARAAVGEEAGAVARDDHALAHPLARPRAPSRPRPAEDSVPATTSSSSISAGGLKKCMPTTRLGSVAPRSRARSPEARRCSSPARRRAGRPRPAARTASRFSSRSSGRRLDHELAARQVLERCSAEFSRSSAGSASPPVQRLRCTPFSRLSRIAAIPRSSASGNGS